MHVDLGVALAGLIVGFTVGLTGMGGGALMTPILVLLFNVQPLAAVSSDLVNSLVMKPVGGSVHLRRGTVQWSLVRWLVVGSVPSAFLGVILLKQLGDSQGVQDTVKLLLGWALLVAAVSMVAKAMLQARSMKRMTALGRTPNEAPYRVKPLPTVLIGVAGGLIVGMTSVGSGSLMIVMLMLLYPSVAGKSLVGTDLVQAIPLVASAALGHLLFGHIDFALTGALILGSLPGVYLGARVSAKAPDGVVRPALVFVLLASALKLLNMDTATLGWTLLVLVLIALPLWGAIDAVLRPSAQWAGAGYSRTFWVSLQGIGAPFGVGFVAAVVYFARVRLAVLRSTAPASAEAEVDAPTSDASLLRAVVV